ncbi:MAG TPA: hypothetical protein VMY39_07915 [Planctomycetota bacterium]|nr:hypothetical protein [Planctomycetota bacterium]HUV39526.1 hypothetical protein [Planctomycetota bacterium]
MRHRRGQSAGISLFAFQDIMASVIGVLFFVVLLMSLDIVQGATTTPVSTSSVNEAQVQALRGEADTLKADVGKLQDEVDKLSDRVEKQFSGEVRRKSETLSGLVKVGERLAEAVKKQREAFAQATKSAGDARDRQKQDLETVQRLRGELATLDGEIAKLEQEIRKYPPPTTEDGIHGEDKAVRVEVAANSLRAGRRGKGLLKTFTGASPAARRMQLLTWAGSIDKTKEHVVVCIKPSGLDDVAEVLAVLQTAGYGIGIELVPESRSPF